MPTGHPKIRAKARKYPNVTVYDFSTGLSWHLTIFSNGAHADAIPITAEDTAKMNKAFGKTTWNPKPVWVMFSDGSVYMASTHNTPHGTYNKERSTISRAISASTSPARARSRPSAPMPPPTRRPSTRAGEVTQKRAGR